MYRSNRSFSELSGLVTGEWTFENAFFDFSQILWSPELAVDKPLHVDDYAGDTSTTGVIIIGGTTTGVVDSATDADWFAVDLTRGESLEATISYSGGNSLNPAFFVYDANGDQVDFTASFRNDDESQSIVFTPTSTGTYYLSTRAHFDINGATYSITARTFVDDYSGNPDFEPANSPLSVGQLDAAGSTITGSIDYTGDQDWFEIQVDFGEKISVLLESLSASLDEYRVFVLDADGNILESSQYGDSPNTFEFAPLASGTYYIAIGTFGDVGDYQITVEQVDTSTPGDDFAGDNSTIGVVNIGGVNNGQMNFVGDIDSFAFNVSAGDAIRLDFAFDEADGYVQPVVRDADGNIITAAFSQFQGSSFIYQFEADGTYYVDMRGGTIESATAMDYAFSVHEMEAYAIQDAVAPFFPDNAFIWAPMMDPGATPDVAPVTGTQLIAINSNFVVGTDDVFYSTDADGGILHVLFDTESDGIFENNGLLWVEASSEAWTLMGIGNVINNGRIIAIGGGFATGVGAGTLDNHGDILAISYEHSATGARLGGSVTQSIQDINTGTITAWSGQSFANGIVFGRGALVDNSGDIRADGLLQASGILLNEGGTVTNSGTITATTGLDNASFGVNSLVELGSINLTNTGTITADIAVAAYGYNTVNNSGVLNGNVVLLSGGNHFGVDDTVINSGTINGNVDLRDYDDVYDGTDGFVDGLILMGAGDDVATGGAQSDFIFGEAGADILTGGSGNDLLDGGLGDDQLFGGAGNDLANYLGALANYEIIDHGNGSYTVTDLVGLDGTDTLVGIERMRFSGLNSEIYNIADIAQIPTGIIDGTDNAETIDGTADDDVIFGRAGDDVLNGLAGDDRLVGGIGTDTLNGGDGDDELDGSQGDDQLNGGTGFDYAVYAGQRADYTYVVNADNSVTVTHNNGDDGVDTLVSIEGLRFADGDVLLGEVAEQLTGSDDVFVGTGGDDFINGLAGNDRISGLAGDDVILGGAGRDTLNGGRGADGLYGGDGNDVLNGSHGDDNLNGGAGNDRLNGGQNNDRLNGGLGDDYLRGNGGHDILDGGLGSDTLVGASGNDILRGGAGDGSADTLHGGAGNDILIVTGDTGNAGGNSLNGNGGNDILRSGIGEDILRGGGGSDELYGGGGADIIWGGTGSDFVDGGDGHDTIFGNGAADTIFGGAGDDLINGGGGNDIITGGSGWDSLEGRGGSDEIHGGSGRDIISGGSSNDILYGDEGDDRISGDGGRDTLYGGAGFDHMYGGGGNDIMYGGADGDTMLGGRFDDQMFGEDGDDDLSGEEGVNFITGGAGSDIFFQTKGGRDVLLDFTPGEDRIDINDITLADFTALLAASTDGVDDNGVYVIVDMGADGSFKIYGQTKATLLETDFNFGPPLPFAEDVPEKRTIAEDVTISEKLVVSDDVVTVDEKPIVSDDDSFVFVEKAVVSDDSVAGFGDFVLDQDVLAEFLAQVESFGRIYTNAEGILEIGPDADNGDFAYYTDFFNFA